MQWQLPLGGGCVACQAVGSPASLAVGTEYYTDFNLPKPLAAAAATGTLLWRPFLRDAGNMIRTGEWSLCFIRRAVPAERGLV